MRHRHSSSARNSLLRREYRHTCERSLSCYVNSIEGTFLSCAAVFNKFIKGTTVPIDTIHLFLLHTSGFSIFCRILVLCRNNGPIGEGFRSRSVINVEFLRNCSKYSDGCNNAFPIYSKKILAIDIGNSKLLSKESALNSTL